jgi:hypothetical protein
MINKNCLTRGEFVILFSDLQATTERGPKNRLATAWKRIVFELRGAATPEPITVYVEGHVFTKAKSTATLVIVANGASRLVAFGPDTDRDFVETVVCTPSDHELSIGVSLFIEGATEDEGVYVNVSTAGGKFDQVQPTAEGEPVAGEVNG